MPDKIRWGILGAGSIAGAMAWAVQRLPDAELVAVGSRRRETADAFADTYGISRRHASYEALAGDPDVDIVYIATPHSLHRENAIMCMNAGKSVLCEKPFAINARQTAEMIARARAKKVFLMEAMWTRTLPLVRRLRSMLDADQIGSVRQFIADFGFESEYDPASRLFDPGLGGGSLLDVGIYPVSLSHFLFGAPQTVSAVATFAPTGVDEQCAIALGHASGALSSLSCANRLESPQEAMILGTRGGIRLHRPWWKPQSMALCRPDNPDERIDMPYDGNGLHHEAAEAMRCLRAGEMESPVMPHAETQSIMETMDRIRAAIGLKYPME